MTGPSELPTTQCGTELRRTDVRAAHLLGLDGAEISDDGRTLTVTFLGRAPGELGPENIRVDGGRRITGLRALAVDIERADDPELDDWMHVTLDRAGDTSRYRLSVVEPDAYGRPGTRPYPGFDPRYASTGFSFGANCPSPYDCRTEESCPPAVRPAPVIDYTARDYESLRRLVLDRMSLTTPGWTERHLPDLGITLVELLAYTADRLAYQQDAVATEAYLDTARRRVSVRRHVRLIDYPVHDGCNARAFVALTADRPLTLRPGTFRFAAVDVSRLGPQERPELSTVIPDEELDTLARTAAVEVFEPLGGADLVLHPAHNTIRFWTWGDQDCVLPRGATSAALRDDRHEADQPEARTGHLALRPGDLLIIEEVLGPRTGAAADADPAHRQAVRLTSVTHLVDELYEQPVVEVTWAPEDALTFPVCLSTHGGSDCGPIDDVSIARGNVALVDHGRSLTFCGGAPETFAVPPEPVRVPPCGPGESGCADRAEGSPAAEAIRELLDQARTGRQLGPDQVRGLYALLGEAAVRRSGLGIQLAPGANAEGEDGRGAVVEPPTADAQAAALETLLDQSRYPVLPQPFRPLLRYAPVTQAAAYPDPAHVGAGQAALLAGIPERVRLRLEELWHRVGDGHVLSRAELAELTLLFGAQVVQELHLADRPAAGLRELLARRTHLLAGKLRRLEVLTARARSGAVLRQPTVWEVAQSWGARYAAGLDPDSPVLAGPAAGIAVQDPRAALPEVRAGIAGQEWTPRRDLLADGRRDRHFVGELEDDGRLALRFGDGRHGLPPGPGTELRVAYRIGNGTAGNVGAEAINHLVICQDQPPRSNRSSTATRPQDAVLLVRNPLPAAGGVEPEPLDQVRQLAPLALSRTRLRAVTAADYAELAAALPGVRRAAAELRWTGSVQEVHVAVEPFGHAVADTALLEAVGHGLEAYRRIGHDLVVRPALLVPLDLELRICAATGYQRGHVLAELRRVLGNRTLPDGRLGFFHPDALGFGEPVRVSRLVAAAAAVPGVLSAQVTRLRRQFGRDDDEPADGLLRLGALEIASCDNDPDWPENGRLSIVIGGGR
ncbi:putative baseplate assembly protein [Streptomyces novaecaesareae]|uniref:putative baseplate assembly protein n=1 Tax=Streptomyces novaecaesareae TaxID=68244 RepID=UPI000527687B|nr:putative baseplate assembly protein [Streptomyces novaecaesareae]